MLVALGGAILSLDHAGRIRWIRRQVTTPASEEPQWTRQFFQSPLVDGTRVYSLQVGVHTIDCVEHDTGELAWSRLLLDAERLIALTGSLLILESAGIGRLGSAIGRGSLAT